MPPGEDPSHTADGPVRLADGFGIALLWLPTRSPEFDPMGTVWGRANEVVSANRRHTTLAEPVDRFIGHLEGRSPE
jgi:hypothetical protein